MSFLHVAAAVVVNPAGEVLIALRPKEKHQGGLWEFPGGKVEPGEEVLSALARELHEELGIEVKQARPLIRVQHRYPDRAVLLDVWRVNDFTGIARGCEGQKIDWISPEILSQRAFPEANLPIITAAQLPDCYLITPEPEADFILRLEAALAQGVRLIQLRCKQLPEIEYKALVDEALVCCRQHGAKLLLNAAPEWVAELGADGVHLNSKNLLALSERPLAKEKWVAASCHNARELQHAAAIGVDFAVLSPIKATASHPEAAPLGWNEARALIDHLPLPVYFLGGMTRDDLYDAFSYGAQGIAAIRGLW